MKIRNENDQNIYYFDPGEHYATILMDKNSSPIIVEVCKIVNVFHFYVRDNIYEPPREIHLDNVLFEGEYQTLLTRMIGWKQMNAAIGDFKGKQSK